MYIILKPAILAIAVIAATIPASEQQVTRASAVYPPFRPASAWSNVALA